MLLNFRADLAHHFGGDYSARRVFTAFFEVSLWAIAIFRFGKWAQGFPITPLRRPLLLCYFFAYKISEAVSGIRISSESEIGPGLLIHNFGGVFIRGKVGANCVFVQGAQLVSRGDFRARGWPTLGDNVYVGSGAKVLGDVRIGDNVRIGANAVVMRDIEADSVVMPPECTIKKRSASARPTTAD